MADGGGDGDEVVPSSCGAGAPVAGEVDSRDAAGVDTDTVFAGVWLDDDGISMSICHGLHGDC